MAIWCRERLQGGIWCKQLLCSVSSHAGGELGTKVQGLEFSVFWALQLWPISSYLQQHFPCFPPLKVANLCKSQGLELLASPPLYGPLS